MSLQSQLAALISSIGADIKALQSATGGTPDRYSTSVTTQVISSGTDTYLAGSRILIPTGKIQAGTIYRSKFSVTKTAAGIAAPTVTVRIGTLGTIADAARGAFGFSAQTAVADEGVIEIDTLFKSGGVTAGNAGLGRLSHRLVTTGLNISGSITTKEVASGSGFDVTGAGLGIGLSVNPGASASWNIGFLSAELLNLAP